MLRVNCREKREERGRGRGRKGEERMLEMKRIVTEERKERGEEVILQRE